MKQVDIIICVLPIQNTIVYPQNSPAILKSVIESNGFICKYIDFNISLWNHIGEDWKYDYEKMWNNLSLKNIDSSLFKKLYETSLSKIINRWIEELTLYKPKWIGFSMFHKFNFSIFIVLEMLELCRKHLPDSKIVIGGNAITVSSFGEQLLSKKLIDAYIKGEGEHTIIELLAGNLNSVGINSKDYVQLNELDCFPYADYSDLNISNYGNGFYVELSRGCLRKCKFCQKVLNKYRIKNGTKVAKEILELYNNYGGRVFEFSDSAFNNNLSGLVECLRTIIMYYENNKMEKIDLKGSMSCFPKNRMTPDIYELMKRAGFSNVGIGIESGSENIRNHMGKKYSNDDIDFMIQQCCRNGIYIGIGIIVGYPLETENDFQQTLDLFTRNSIFKDNIGVYLGSTCYISRDTWLYDHQLELDIYEDHSGEWVCGKTNNTIEIRYNRWVRLKEHCKNLGYFVNDQYSFMLETKSELKDDYSNLFLHDGLKVKAN